jgi:hypothetical protein
MSSVREGWGVVRRGVRRARLQDERDHGDSEGIGTWEE